MSRKSKYQRYLRLILDFGVSSFLCTGCVSPVPRSPTLPPLPKFQPFVLKAEADPQSTNTAKDVQFKLPANACVVQWTLQGSTNLVDWFDMATYGVGCPNSSLDVTPDQPQFFFRLKGLTP